MATLPPVEEALAKPEHAAEVVQGFVKASLAEEWRKQRGTDDEFLQQLSDLINASLLSMPSEDTETSQPGERLCVAGIKLARNLCSGGNRAAQECWWRRGVAESLSNQVRKDLGSLPGSRSQAWCEAVPSFLANSVAMQPDLREEALRVLFPRGLAAVFTLCWHRVGLAFLLASNLLAPSVPARDDEDVAPTGNGAHTAGPFLDRVICSQEGIYILYILMSLVDATSAGTEAGEWASIFFQRLWFEGVFAQCYTGMKAVDVKGLGGFLSSLASMSPEKESLAPLGLPKLTQQLCSHKQALAMMWHTLAGLLEESSAQGSDDAGSASKLAQRLLANSGFTKLLCKEMMSELHRLSSAWALDWKPVPAPPEALSLLGLSEAAAAELLFVSNASQQGGSSCGDDTASSGDAEEVTADALVYEMLQAAVTLTSTAGSRGLPFPAELVSTILSGNVSFIQSLHRLRFGNVDAAQPKAKPSAAARNASQHCCLVDHVRLCGNLLYENPPAQDFLRASSGLGVLLSHCYADPDLPLLREAGLFAIRNATHKNSANQEMVRDILSERKQAGTLEPALAELDV